MLFSLALQYVILLRKIFNCFKRSIADAMLHFAGILCGGFFVNAKRDEKVRQERVARVDFFGDLAPRIGECYGTVGIDNNKAAILKQAHRAADRGLGVTHFFANGNGIVRHPMYAVTVWLFLSIPLVLGSFWSLLCFAPYPIVIVARILNEEKVLTAELDGYADYKKKVKYRLLPFVW